MKSRKTKKVFILLAAAATLVILGAAVTAWQNTHVVTTTFDVSSDRIESPMVIAQISDYHGCERYRDQVLQILKDERPDVIAITGDFIDEHHDDEDFAAGLAEEFCRIAPTYYVTGNHELMIDIDPFLQRLEGIGVTVLRKGSADLSGNIRLTGVNDPYFYSDLSADPAEVLDRVLQDLPVDRDRYNVLLSHRPEAFAVYRDAGYDLVLSGHTHGGQFRLPFFGGLAAPNQGLFPKYDAGAFTESGTTMIVSRGIGDTFIPVRINNPPEVVIVRMK